MSASSKKKERKLQEAEALKATENGSKMSKGTKETILVVVVAVVVLAAIAVSMMVYSNQKNKPDYDVSVPAGTVGGENVSVPMMNYFYMDAVSGFYNNYSSYISLFFDPTVPLNEQEYNDSFIGSGESYATWDDYFIATAKDSAADTYNLYNAAVAEGIKLTDEETASIDSAMENLETNASNNGFKNVDTYLATLYGPGCDIENYREYVEIQTLASNYYSKGMEAITVSDDEITSSYAEDSSKYDRVTCYVYTARPTTTYDDDGNPVEPTAEEIAAAAADAEEMKANFEVAKATAMNFVSKENLTANYGEDAANWLFAEDRQENDVDSFKSASSENVTYVVQFVSRDDLDFDTVDLKVIKINPDSEQKTDSEEASEEGREDAEEGKEQVEEKAPAAERIQEAYDKLSANPTEETMDALITEYSEDANVATDKGVRTNVTKNTFTNEITSWLFNAKHNAGDFQMFETDTGCYLIWFTDYNENYRHQVVESALTAQKQTEWYEGIAHSNELVADDTMMAHMRTGIAISSFFSTGNNQGAAQ